MRSVILALSALSSAALADPGEPFWPHVRGAFTRSWIGVEAQNMTPDLRRYFGAPVEQGVLLAAVSDGSPAAKAGLRAGDVVVRAAGKELRRVGDLIEAVAGVEPGEALALELVRDKKPHKLEVKVARNPDAIEFDEAMQRLRKGGDRAIDDLRERLERLEKKLDEVQRELRKS